MHVLARPSTAALGICLAVAALAAGCGPGGGGGGGGGGKAAEIGLRATAHALGFVADESVPGTSLAHAAGLLDQAVANQATARETLDAMANSPDPFGVLFARALCTGMAQIKDGDDNATPPSQSDWQSFFVDELNILAPGNSLGFIQGKVNGFMTTVDLAQVNPSLARTYWTECVTNPR